jgi:hypothetical protein
MCAVIDYPVVGLVVCASLLTAVKSIIVASGVTVGNKLGDDDLETVGTVEPRTTNR